MIPAALFPRSFLKDYPQAVRGKGCWIYTADGKKYLDAAGQAAVVSIGYGEASVAAAMARQAEQLAFVHSSQFHTEAAEHLASRLLQLSPEGIRKGGRVYFCCGGSEANETAIKMARQYQLERNRPGRFKVISRRQSYHGSTLGAMAISGNVARRNPYQPLLPEWGHIPPCFPTHCELNCYPECSLACLDDLETLLRREADSVAAFIFEPVVGATLGAAVPPAGYVQRVAEICRHYEILLIADEVMTGMGRTGKNFAVGHWSIEPDIMTLGKGVASGYAPLGAVIAGPRVVEAIAHGSGRFEHGFTYQAHPVSMAAGNAVLDVLEAGRLLVRVDPAGRELFAALAVLKSHPNVGEIRGLGLLAAIEFVADKATRAPFAREENVCEGIRAAAMEHGVLTYPTQGCVDGVRGDHILLAPPFIISSEECRIISRAISGALDNVFGT